MLSMLLAVTASPSPAPGGGLMSFLPLLLIFGAMYFLMIRPQRARMKAAQELIQSLQVGDEVQTAGGMFGRITRMTDEHTWVEIAPGTEIKFLRRAIVGKVQPEGPLSDAGDGTA